MSSISNLLKSEIDNFVDYFCNQYKDTKHKFKARVRGERLIFLCEFCDANKTYLIVRVPANKMKRDEGYTFIEKSFLEKEFNNLCKRFDIFK